MEKKQEESPFAGMSMEELVKKMIEHTKELYQNCGIEPVAEVGEQREVMLPMSDGVKLRTTILLPKFSCTKEGEERQEAVPVVLQRSCYPMQEKFLLLHAEEYCKRGFGFVLQWCRGTGGSEGIWEPNVNERQDGLDTLNWLEEQPFARSVGYWGNSYLALTGWCMADAVPEKVKTMYLGVYGTDRHTSAYKDGLFRQDILTAWAMDNAGKPVTADYMESARFRPQMEVDEALWETRLDWYRDWIGNTDRDCEYWSREGFWRMLKEIPGKVKIPIFLMEGWYDHHLGSAIVTYGDLSEEAKAHSVFQIGPWNHGHMPAVKHQPIDRLEDDAVSSPLHWFYQILMKEELPERAVETYVIGANRWETWREFPVPTDRKEFFYLHADRQTLEKTEQDATQVSYSYDPDNPVISYGAESCFKTQTAIGSLIQPECNYRPDVLSFVSEPLPAGLEINGSIHVTLAVSSDAEDTAFTAKVMEVFPDGQTVNIRGSITTLAYRNGRTTRGTYTPGEVVEIDIPMWEVAWELQAGSRLRVDISSSDFPQYAVHSNYLGVWSVQKETKVARQTIYTGGSYASRIELPIVEGKGTKE